MSLGESRSHDLSHDLLKFCTKLIMHDPVALKSSFACIILEPCLILLEVSDSVDSAKSSV